MRSGASRASGCINAPPTSWPTMPACVQPKRIHQRQHVGGLLVGAEQPLGLVAVAEAAQVGRIQREAIGKPRHDRLPGQPEFRPAMQQQQRPPGADAGHMKRRAIGLNRQMLHFWLPFLLPGAGADFLAPRLVWPAILA